MKKNLTFFFLFSIPGLSYAGGLAVFYESEAAVNEGRFVVGAMVSSEAVISMPPGFSLTGSYFVAPFAEPLKVGSLSRLDNELKVAVIKIGAPVPQEAIQKSHAKNMERFMSSFPSLGVESKQAPFLTDQPTAPLEPLLVKINGREIGSTPIELKAKRNESEVELEIVRPSTAPVWRVSLLLESNPPLSFWLKGKKRTLKDVPTRRFQYDYQVFGLPLASGRSIKIPIQIFFVKDESYTWALRVETKPDTVVRNVPVRFEHFKK